jgi:hypothetical protein
MGSCAHAHAQASDKQISNCPGSAFRSHFVSFFCFNFVLLNVDASNTLRIFALVLLAGNILADEQHRHHDYDRVNFKGSAEGHSPWSG